MRPEINIEMKTIKTEMGTYPLKYALLCPITGKPIMAVVYVEKHQTKAVDQYHARYVYESGRAIGLLYEEMNRAVIVSDGARQRNLRYFYGYKDLPLIDFMLGCLHPGRKFDRNKYESIVLAGKLKGVYLGREVVKGEDLIIAVDADEYEDSYLEDLY